MDVLRAFLHGTVVLFGPSGTGKSTLGNHVLGQERLATGAVRESDGKGRHTTAWRELVPLPGGAVLLDTPGVRAIGLHESTDGVEQVFAEITHLAQGCRLTDCAHESEPGCAVLSALERGELSRRRMDSYRRLLRENAHAAARTDARLRAEHKAINKKRALDLRALYRFRDKPR